MALLKFLCHFNGIDGAKEAIDESPSNHIITFNNNAQLDTAYKKFGTAALYMPAASDKGISMADSPDWDIFASASDDWTIDCFLRIIDLTQNYHYLADQRLNSDNYWSIFHLKDSGFRFQVRLGAAFRITVGYGGPILDNDWHHFALVKKAGIYGLYVDGIQKAYTSNSYTGSLTASLYIGATSSASVSLKGHIDEFRIYNCNVFNANPNVGLTDTIVVPTGQDIPMYGSVAGVSNVFASLTIIVGATQLTGSLSGQSSVLGSILNTLYVTGASLGQTLTDGELKVLRKVLGSLSGQTLTNGELKVLWKVLGSCDAQSVTEAELKVLRKVLGSVVGQSLTDAELKVLRKVLGSLSGQSTIFGLLKAYRKISGSLDSHSLLSATIRFEPLFLIDRESEIKLNLDVNRESDVNVGVNRESDVNVGVYRESDVDIYSVRR